MAIQHRINVDLTWIRRQITMGASRAMETLHARGKSVGCDADAFHKGLTQGFNTCGTVVLVLFCRLR